jgi:hypothetical protein
MTIATWIGVVALVLGSYYVARIWDKLNDIGRSLRSIEHNLTEANSTLRNIDHNSEVIRERTPHVNP